MADRRKLLSAKVRAAAAQLRFLPRAWRLVWSAARHWTSLWAALLVAQGILPVAIVFLTRELVDGFAGIVGSGADWTGLDPIVAPAALMGGVLLLGEVLRAASDWVRTVQAALVEDHVSRLVHAQSTAVDLAFYETPEHLDHLHRARDESGARPIALLENGGRLIQNGITLVAMAAVLFPYGPWMSIALVVSAVPALLVVVRFAVQKHEWRQRTTEDHRRTGYYDWLMTDGATAAELRLFGLGGHFRSAYASLRTRLREGQLHLNKSQGLAELGASATALVISAACLAWMAYQAVRGQATLGDLALFYQAFSLGQQLVRSLLGDVGQIYYNVLFLGDLFAFLDLKSDVRDPPHPRAAPAVTPPGGGLGVRFDEVTFGYPRTERLALQSLSLAIPAGQIAAIVGTNGAGKSTLMKLLCRFYDPRAGRIEIGGVDLRDLSLADLRRLLTVLFQEPVHYSASVAENIAVNAPLTAAIRADVEAAARAAGAEALVAGLPRGFDTPLGKWFTGGVELSVGEWQRIALARAFWRQAPVIILDEPTSAMDSWAEGEWLQRFRSLAANRTALIVTHRFTTAMQADVIHVMDGGLVIGSGGHSELVTRGGAYARSWHMQIRTEQGAAER